MFTQASHKQPTLNETTNLSATPRPEFFSPKDYTIAISREAGSRGGSIAEHLGILLNRPVYTQEMVDFLAFDDRSRAEFLSEVPAAARAWADLRTAQYVQSHHLTPGSDAAIVTRLLLILAAQGGTIIVGRGAGFILPPDSTIHVFVTSPLELRVAYMSQRLRLSESEAEAEVKARDHRRSEFLATLSDQTLGDIEAFDLVVNSARLGVELCAELIAHAVKNKQSKNSLG